MKDPRKSFFVQLRLRHPVVYDFVSMAFYVLLVYGLGLGISPLGRDYATLAEPFRHLPRFSALILTAEIKHFGESVVLYHLLNMALLYACMLFLSVLSARLFRAPFWLGTLTATLFMANPAYGEAVLNVTGISDLLPCFWGLLAITVICLGKSPKPVFKVLAEIILLLVASIPFPTNALLPWVAVLAEYGLRKPNERSPLRFIGYSLCGLFSTLFHSQFVFLTGGTLVDRFAPLYFLFYPLGLLPKTAYALHEHAWLGWISALVILAVIVGIARKTQNNIFLFGILACGIVRAAGSVRQIDPVHLIGAGQLLLPSAFYHLGLIGLISRMMENPKWRVTLTSATTIWCVVYFATQINQDVIWRQASKYVEGFKKECNQAASVAPDQEIVICPDFLYYRGAPVCLSEAISYDTPFSNRVRWTNLLVMNYFPVRQMKWKIENWSEREAQIVVSGVRPVDVACAPDFALAKRNQPVKTVGGEAALVDVGADKFRLIIHFSRPLRRDAVLPSEP